jgi:serine/threonine-protein kinase
MIAHPSVVRVVDFGRDEATGSLFLVMERIDGENLAARLRRGCRLGEAEVRRLGAAIADGMQAAHDQGIVHRDLKPANVMLSGGQPKIVDFGIAKHLGDRSAVETGRRIGTPAYMAPEQLTGGLISPFVDIWALGVILFEAATGRLPFDGFADGRAPQLFETAPPAGVSPGLDDLIAHCLEREPGRRPRSMTEIARVLRGEETGIERVTVDAGPVPAPPPRRRWPLIAGVATGAVALVVLAASLLGASDASSDPDAAAAPDAAPAAAPDASARPERAGEAGESKDDPKPRTRKRTKPRPPEKTGRTGEGLD